MIRRVRLYVNDAVVEVPADASVAVAVAQGGKAFRRSHTGMPRMPFCGMGVCFECRVRIDGDAHVPACITPAREGMRVRTDD